MANWEVTKTTKHGRPIEEHTAKIGKDQWKIESMPHISPNFGSLNRWDDLRGLRQISTGNIEMLKRQAEEISTKKDAVSDLLRGFSRPGEPDTFAVEDRFYFGKGRKERFADDAKQIADTILKQLGGGRFIAMTGAKNLAFASNPPGLHMSIGRGAKSGIKYLRINYDRGSDTYTMKFLNNSGGTVREQSFVHADQLRRVFTSTTGFDTSL